MPAFPKLTEPYKSISVFPGWSAPEEGTGYIYFDAPLEIDGVTEANFQLHGGCLIRMPARHISFEIRIGRTPGRKHRPLARLDWRSLTGGHSNKRRPLPDGVSGKRTMPTHLHGFDINWDAERGRMIGPDLPFANDLDRELNNFLEVRQHAGMLFKINNMEIVTEPEWELGFL